MAQPSGSPDALGWAHPARYRFARLASPRHTFSSGPASAGGAAYHARIILNGEPRALANRANAKTKGLAAPCFKRTGRIVTGRNQYTTKIEDRHISARAKALGFATVRANERGADGRLRRTGAFRFCHVVVFPEALACRH